MENRERGLIGIASVYTKKYFFNKEFDGLPQQIKDEIRVICSYYAEKLHCEFAIKFNDKGGVYLETNAPDTDYNFDEIGAKLDIDKLTRENQELFRGLSIWYKIFVLGEEAGLNIHEEKEESGN